jgi:hypothetical protein
VYEDLNNGKHFRTQKGMDIIAVKNYLVEKICENENIRKYCRWVTKTPLGKNGLGYNGDIIVQHHLDDKYDLRKEVIAEKGLCYKQILYPYMFNEDIVDLDQMFMFVYPYSNNFNKSMGTNVYQVTICMPIEYNEISPYGDERIYRILHEIIDMFDGIIVTEEKWVERIGNVQFDIKSTSYPERLTKTKTLLKYSLNITTKLSNVR